MRIIAGKYKNRQIITETSHIKLEAKKIRPTTEKLRAAVFNLLYNFFGDNHNNLLHGKKVLDLCCGIGSFGLEALSRGAEKVAFLDNQRQHLEIVKLNLEKIGCAENSKLIFANVQRLGKGDDIYDLVYIDPPYRLNILNQIINSLIAGEWIKPESIIIIESSAKERTADNMLQSLSLLDKRQYGNSVLSFYTYR